MSLEKHGPGLPLFEGPAPAKDRGKEKRLLSQFLICALCVVVSALHPMLLEVAKTATQREVRLADAGGHAMASKDLAIREYKAYPFSGVSLAVVTDLVKLVIGLLIVAKRYPEGIRVLWGNRKMLAKMAPLGFLYALGELLALRAVEKGTGSLYAVLSNSRLVMTAMIARAFFGRSRSMPYFHWLELLLITGAAAGYTVWEATSSGATWQWEGVEVSLIKSALAALLAVIYEHTYKGGKLVVTLTLQVFWGLVAFALLYTVSATGLAFTSVAPDLTDDLGENFSFFHSGPRYALCSSDSHTNCVDQLMQGIGAGVCHCASRRGWDAYTLLALFGDLMYAVSTALVFKSLSAVTKYICGALSTVPIYATHCVMGKLTWSAGSFTLVLYLVAQVAAYTMHRHGAMQEQAKATWVKHYS